MTDQGFAIVEALDAIAKARSTTIPAVALAWELTRPAIQAPIIGANSPEQLEALLPVGDVQLSAEDVASLDAVSAGT